jgi:hypothetical protein
MQRAPENKGGNEYKEVFKDLSNFLKSVEGMPRMILNNDPRLSAAPYQWIVAILVIRSFAAKNQDLQSCKINT